MDRRLVPVRTRRDVEAGNLSDGGDAGGVQLGRRGRPHAPDALNRKGVQECQLALDRHDEQPIWLAQAAGDLGQVFGPGYADRDGKPRPLAHVATQGSSDDGWFPAQPPQATDIEERFVDRHAFHERSGVMEDLENLAAGRDISIEVRPDDDGVGAEPHRLASAHGGAHAVGLRLVAGGQHDPTTDDDRFAAQARVIALLDRREERVEVGMQDGAFGDHR
jgi:hypothetical protein